MQKPAALLLLGFLFLLFSACTPSLPDDVAEALDRIPDRVDYNYHIKPILSDRCYACHGPDDNAREAGFRLDLADSAFKELPESPGLFALKAGNLRKSQVFHRILEDDVEEMMPPPESNLSLSAEDKAYLIRWIDQGAKYKEHWSFIPPEKPLVPRIDHKDWPVNEIDHFVAEHFEQAGLSPSPEANKEALIRRVTFDLTGLPPTLEEIDAFLDDDSPEAYEKVINRLLESPRYGERMGVEWLDIARYADSHGYQDDGMRNTWPWRDWVIKAFNENLPFDDFVTWQMAGDLLPNPTDDQLLATAFNRHHMQSQEGGIVPEEYRVEYVADRVQTLGTAFLGLTLQCARCHDHKYDPISQAEYYQLFAYFNSINEFGNIPYAGESSPTVLLLDDETKAEVDRLFAEIKAIYQKGGATNTAYDAGFEAWIKEAKEDATARTVEPLNLVGHFPLDSVNDFETVNLITRDEPAMIEGDRDFPPEIVDGIVGKALKSNGETWFGAQPEAFAFERNEPFSLSLWVNMPPDVDDVPIVGRAGGYFDGNRGYIAQLREGGRLSWSLNHSFPDNSIEIQSLDPFPTEEWLHLVLTYDGSNRAEGLAMYINGELVPAEILVDNLQKSIVETYSFYNEERTNWVNFRPLRLGMLDHNQARLGGVVFDDLRIYGSELTLVEARALHGDVDPIGAILGQAQASEEELAALRHYYAIRHEPAYQADLRTLKTLVGEINELTLEQQEVMIMRDRKHPRPTYILNRGLYDSPTTEVSMGTPAILPAIAEDRPDNRLGLAEWLVSPEHPLTARVTVNRFWQQYFGNGFVGTPEDFGNQGELPTHPELLDWLAVTFQESGWDVKGLQKMIVMSATYRQSSNATAALLDIDPENILLARGPRYRMTAEMIRDNALAVSGLLSDQIGGPSVHPYQPEGLWQELATRNATEYKQDEGEELYRRGMYTIWKRSTPPPSMMSFDATERAFCAVQRQTTNTPLQALILLNDPQYVEAARMLAERMLKEGGENIDAQITFAFRLLTSRHPDEKEAGLLKQLYEEEKAAFNASGEALSLLEVGEARYDTTLDPIEIASRTIVASTIMNFDEAYMKR